MTKMAYFSLFFDPKNFFKKLKIRPLDDFFEGLEVGALPHKQPLRSQKNTLKPSKNYRFCQLENHFFRKIYFRPSASQVS